MSAPARATTEAVLKRRVGPCTVISSPAADGPLPASRFASLNDRSSIGPDGGTPTAQ